MSNYPHHIKSRILAPLGIVLILLLCTSIYVIYNLQTNEIENDIEDRLDGLESLFSILLDAEVELISSQFSSILSDSLLLDHWANRDQDRLYQKSQSIFDEIKNEYNITHLYFINPDQNCFLRTHKPALSGDKIQHEVLNKLLAGSDSSAGIELGVLGTFSLRVVRPVYFKNTLLGYLELGKEIEHITPRLRQIMGSELIFLIDKENLRYDSWLQYHHDENRRNSWDDFSNFVIVDHATTIPDSILIRQIPDFGSNVENETINIKSNGQTHRGGLISLKDASDKHVGYILLLHNISEQIRSLKWFIFLLILASVVIGQLLFVSFSLYIGSIEGKLNTIHGELQDEIKQHTETMDQLKDIQNHLEERVENQTKQLRDINKQLTADIERRRIAEAELKKQSNFVLSLFESLSHPFYVVDAEDYSIIMANSATGLDPESPHTTCHAFTHNCPEPCFGDDHPCPLDIVKKTGRPTNTEHIHINQKNEKRVYDIHGYPIFDESGKVIQMIEYVVDITEKRQIENEKANLEALLSHAQRLETIGELVDSVAHEINTPMGIIAAHTDALALQHIDENCREDLQIIRDQIRRISQYTRSLLGYSRRAPFKPEPCSILQLIDESVYLVGHRTRAQDIHIFKDYPSHIPDLLCDRVQLEQVFINLINNAVDAMEPNGEIRISVHEIELKAQWCAQIKITDNGPGISPEIHKQIFESFFTTKPRSKGTGLGLSISKAIIQRHQGQISVESDGETGTEFTIFIPFLSGGN